MCYQLYSKIHGLNFEQMGVTDLSRMARPKSEQTIEPGKVFKGEDIVLDVQELTECIKNMNAKSLNFMNCNNM